MNLREAAKMALETCTDVVNGWESLAPLSVRRAAIESLDALRAALAEPEQEPVLEVRCFGEKRVFVTLIPVEQLNDGDKLYRGLPQIKPVGYFRLEQGVWCQYHEDDVHPETLIPLYTAPTPRKPLTEEEIWALYYALPSDDFERSDRIDFARAIEKAHGIGEQT